MKTRLQLNTPHLAARSQRRDAAVTFATGVFLALAGFSGCKPATAPTLAKPAPPLNVQIASAGPGEIARTITLPASRILAAKEVTLCAKVSGYLKTLAADKGDEVKQGEVLAEIEVPELLADLDQFAAEVAVARTNYERMAEARLKAADLVVPQTVDDLRAQWQVAEAKLKHTQTMLDYTHIVAPFSGVVTARYVDPGAFIPAATSGGTSQGSAMLTLMDCASVRVQVFVPEAEVSFIRKGTRVKVMPDASPGKILTATVTRSSYALDSATKTLLAEIEISNSKDAIRPGGYANVQLEMERKNDALLVPLPALLVEKVGPSLFTIVEGKAKKTPVLVGFNDGVNVEIKEGIKAGQSVILLGKQTLADGQSVMVTEAK